MYQIEITIDKLLDSSSFPNIVECSLYDTWDKQHKFIEKLPVVSSFSVIAEDAYPCIGFIRCELIRTWSDNDGRTIITVSTEKPDYVETIDGLMEFDLLENQVIRI